MKIIKLVNEVGNPVVIKVKNKFTTSENEKTKETIKFKGVSVSITRSAATSEWVITKLEAEKLQDTLKEFLG